MKNSKIQSHFKERSKFHFIIFLIIGSLYTISSIFVYAGMVVLIIMLLFGGIDSKGEQIFALGILLYFPLRYLKEYMGK